MKILEIKESEKFGKRERERERENAKKDLKNYKSRNFDSRMQRLKIEIILVVIGITCITSIFFNYKSF